MVANPIISPVKDVRMHLPKDLTESLNAVKQMGPLLKGLHPVVPDNGYYNAIAAFRKRCNYHTTKRASEFVVCQALKFVERVSPAKMESFEWTESLYHSWLDKFSQEKQARMNAAIDVLCATQVKDYSRKDIFVKVEALLVTHKPNWAPRVIYKGTDVYNAISGPIFNELMRRLDHCFENMRGPYRFRTAYRKTADQFVPFIERDTQGNQFWLEADFSSNDKYQCADVILLEMKLMRQLGCPEWFIRLHMKTDVFKVYSSKHGIAATLEHQLATGNTDTTFRNTFWNAALCFASLVAMKAPQASALVLGDDMLARVDGPVKYAEKTYTSICSQAQMEAKVVRHKNLWTATFLSRFFVPHEGVMHLTVPIIGKALARFNMRANNNQAVSDHSYMAGKAMSYAYEFRFYPTLRDVFLERCVWEHKQFLSKKDTVLLQENLSWNSRQAGVTLSNVKDKLVTKEFLSDYDFNAFCFERYGLMSHEVIDLFKDVVLSNGKTDVDSITARLLAVDFHPEVALNLDPNAAGA